MSGSHEATFYVQIEPEWSRWVNSNGDRWIRALKAAGMTQRWPNRPRPGTVTVKVSVRIPDAAFLPLRPEAVIVLNEDMVEVNPIEVEAQVPHE